MDRLEGENMVQEWFADDAAYLGEINPVENKWDQINYSGPKYDYFLKASSCWLICKNEEKQLTLTEVSEIR